MMMMMVDGRWSIVDSDGDNDDDDGDDDDDDSDDDDYDYKRRWIESFREDGPRIAHWQTLL